jgi:DNA-directed RNA polymerase specialized sigma24 family protein
LNVNYPIRQLPRDEQCIVRQCLLNGKRLEEFARAEAMSSERVKSRLRRAKQRLKENDQLKKSYHN